ncbi:MAG: hypothetical protein QOH76_3967 [Thermoleophilaceae bacterium]|jgi:hypothetical protein|nr:hypothetical protein [Thermoleophilaceae bacterium]
MAAGLAMNAGIAVGSAAFHAVQDAIEQRRERREEKAELIEALEAALVTSHTAAFPLTRAPEWVEPDLVDRAAVRREYRTRATAPFKWWQWLKRHRAGREAVVEADRWADNEDRRLRDEAVAMYERACELWPGLQANDPETVLAALEDAFADNMVPAFAVDCDEATASVAMVTGTSDELPSDEVVRDGRGSAQFRRRTNGDELHRDSALSNMLATAKETLAVAPFIETVQVVGLERRGSLLRKRDRLVPICLLRLTRGELSGVDWWSPLATIVENCSLHYELDDEGRALESLDLEDEPDVVAVVEEVAEALDCRC